MSESAYITLVDQSKHQTITLKEIEEILEMYQLICQKTGAQLGWDYHSSSFPYNVEEIQLENTSFLLLRGNNEKYSYILMGVQTNLSNEDKNCVIQITLPNGYTQGDKNKAIEFSKYITTQVEGELILFNKRKMYFYKR
ncbi:DUF1885 family protein [Pontibacillus yanchengensis]|uniref:DUF1885 domain-containing protein n=1 Tax=Pontibacillus yanchengensis Y32 TaxID=1385514 RepID=A0A0A2TCZ8_9BACI|nr:DUF1885 family protein [Pontibacillus yanchengensis]KGP72288.1 hypothetical protein N782_13145 [Pontibacillus yanchengensis Y32]